MHGIFDEARDISSALEDMFRQQREADPDQQPYHLSGPSRGNIFVPFQISELKEKLTEALKIDTEITKLELAELERISAQGQAEPEPIPTSSAVNVARSLHGACHIYDACRAMPLDIEYPNVFIEESDVEGSKVLAKEYDGILVSSYNMLEQVLIAFNRVNIPATNKMGGADEVNSADLRQNQLPPAAGS